MLEKALKYLVGMGRAEIKNVTLPDGTVQVYSDRRLDRLDRHYPLAEPVKMSTLTSLVDYIRSDTDAMAEKMIIQVESPEKVSLFSQLNGDRKRECLAVVKAQAPSFAYDRFTDHEAFLIGIQAKFLDDPQTDKALLLRFSGAVESGSLTEYGDDGVTQKATVRNGIASKTDAVVPNPVKLRPYRTFAEVEQPASSFVFRMSDTKNGISCALFEADGGAWRNLAMESVKEYLQKELKEFGAFTVIS